MGYDGKAKANVDTESRGSSLVGECGEGHKGQSSGHSIGTGQKGANTRGLPQGGDSQVFGRVNLKAADTFKQAGHVRDGKLRMSGNPAGHRLGKK